MYGTEQIKILFYLATVETKSEPHCMQDESGNTIW